MSKKLDEVNARHPITTSAGRLDKYLATLYPEFSRSYLQRLINHRHVVVDGHPVSPHHNLRPGQEIFICWPLKNEVVAIGSPQSLPFPVLYEDTEVLVINKPAGLLCHPSGWRRDGTTLVEILRPHVAASGWPDDVRPGLIHRLDRDTSGVLVYAKTPEAHARISSQFSQRKVKKMYTALIRGVLDPEEGTFECAIGRDPRARKKFAVTAEGRWAMTQFETRVVYGEIASLVELSPLTGRTHQLRVQLSTVGHPILGDQLYGRKDARFDFIHRQLLHATRLEFTHPSTQKKMKFETALPDDFQAAIKLIRSKL